MKYVCILVCLLGFCIGCDSDSNISATPDSPATVVGPTKTIDVPGTYPRIQQAINAAGSGDFVRVAAGTYTENIRLSGKDIGLRGAGRGQTILVGSVQLYGVSQTSLEGFTIQGGGVHVRNSPVRITNNEILQSPIAGLWLESCQNVVISDNLFKNNQHEGMLLDDSSGVIGSNTVIENVMDGIVVNNSASTLFGNVVSSNGRDGISIRGFTAFSTPSLLSNTVQDNGGVSNYDIVCFGGTNPTGMGNIYGDCINCSECRSFGDPVTYQNDNYLGD